MQIYAKNTHDRYFYETFANNLHFIHEYKFQFSFKITRSFIRFQLIIIQKLKYSIFL